MGQPKLIGSKKIKILDSETTAPVVSGGKETIKIFPPEGKKWTLLNVFLEAQGPTSGTGGTHEYSLHYLDASWKSAVVRIYAAYNDTLTLRGNVPKDKSFYNVGVTNHDKVSGNQVVLGTCFTKDMYLTIEYTNGVTGGTNTLRRYTLVVVEEEL